MLNGLRQGASFCVPLLSKPLGITWMPPKEKEKKKVVQVGRLEFAAGVKVDTHTPHGLKAPRLSTGCSV